MTYLHPSQRNLKTEQIGPSSHKNEYHVGVLEGNWFEERYGFGEQPQKSSQLERFSVAKQAYPPRSSEEYAMARSHEATISEAPRQLLFEHGHSQRSMLSTAELSYPDLTKEGTQAPKVKELTSVEGVSNRKSLIEKKKKEWEAGMGDDRFVTTKKATFDATGEYVKDHYEYKPGPSTRCGAFLRSAGSVMSRTGLRADM